MARLTLLRAADRLAVPWKNGGGVTREVAASPDGAGFDRFDWRISMAEVASDGPFSLFPGVDRTLAMLSGTMRLAIAGDGQSAGVHDLTPYDPPLAFAGDVPVMGSLPGGPASDLNLMVRRGRYRAALRRLTLSEAVAIDDGMTAIVIATAPTVVRLGEQTIALDVLDALRIDGAGHCTIAGDALLATVQRQSSITRAT
ncbi:HutD/Ves family protein [Sphingomonas abietis]|uniref:HutD family protein n=1 Tax=Sphingomonas abietis TaxID=3012344 RepID=A0ABY7NNC4_9SPHN|nr:HutD family protein [Sphingomonas abietis]WBO21006.1 HutD family protein [Sphingomonas abietis]